MDEGRGDREKRGDCGCGRGGGGGEGGLAEGLWGFRVRPHCTASGNKQAAAKTEPSRS